MTLRLKIWLLAARPKTLTAAFVPVLAGTALAQYETNQFSWPVMLFSMVSALLIQIATNFINDMIDHKKGADTSSRIGPTRMAQAGLISTKHLKLASVITLVLAFFMGVPLVLIGGWPIALIGILSLFMAYSYTGGPFPLAYLGLGDLFVVIFFGLIAVGGIYYLHTGTWAVGALLLGLQIGFLSTVLIAINNLRDIHQDVLAGKKTIPVRFGVAFAKCEIYFLLFLPFLLQFYWVTSNPSLWSYLPLIFLPLAVKIALQIHQNEPSRVYNSFLAQSALLHGGFGVVMTISLYLA